MSDYGGFVIVVDEPKRAFAIRQRIEAEGAFSDTLSSSDWHPKQNEIALIALEGGRLQAACLARRGPKVATAKYRVWFSHLVPLNDLPLSELGQKLSSRLADHFERTSSGGGGRVPPRTWEAVMHALRTLRPDIRDELDRLEQLRTTPGDDFSRYRSAGFGIVAQEKDATVMALDFAGVRRRNVLLHPQRIEEPAPFLQGIESARVLEDTMVEHDSSMFDDWEPVRRYRIGGATFGRGANRVTVINVNRRSIEHTLGVDLLYYTHTFEAFVLVQYKRMVQREGAAPVYYPSSDASYASEIERMRGFLAAQPQNGEATKTQEFRLHEGPFYFKFCPALVYDPLGDEPIDGFYLPLQYLLLLAAEGRGERGGVVVSPKTIDRVIGNRDLVRLVRDGWIGSRGGTTEAISRLVRGLLDADHSLILAEARSTVSRSSAASDALLPPDDGG